MATNEVEIPVIDAVRSPFDTEQIAEHVAAIMLREEISLQVQLNDPSSEDAQILSQKDSEFLEYVELIARDTSSEYGGFNACNDLSFTNGRGWGWHFDTPGDWLTPGKNNSFSGLSMQKTRRGGGPVYMRLGTELLLEPQEWLELESQDNALLYPRVFEEPRFAELASTVQYSGEAIPGRWTLFSHGMRQLGQLPLWHYFGQFDSDLREATCVFYDSATVDHSQQHFSGLALPIVANLMLCRGSTIS